ncbi:uncharacterized protein LOC122363990 [Amphibalanus amphitrite]|uniref:uncharacterized protein LOC122363990 n=1 Tax=Amphibalanus amphitrite TaxID=1232801 RepID=UPI001C90D2A6|nr:uncharacterized protein LOC122363990 [Amphibalanus amphitrite]
MKDTLGFGLPDTIVSDNGPAFIGEEFQRFTRRNGIRHVRTAPHRPVSDRVYARGFGSGPVWSPGVVGSLLGATMAEVRLDDGRLWRRHFDQLRSAGDSAPKNRTETDVCDFGRLRGRRDLSGGEPDESWLEDDQREDPVVISDRRPAADAGQPEQSSESPGVQSSPAARLPSETQERFDAELRLWIEEGWLRPYNEQEHGPVRGLIPLMAVTQEAKDKVRPVLDYRELNEHLVAHTAEADVCRDQLRKWRQHGDDVAVIDLKKAFLQLYVAQELWPFQTVIVDGQRHCLTRVGFGLSVASGIMRAVVREVLDQSPEIAKALLPYADDLLVNETLISAERVTEHFAAYGLSCKSPERVADEAGARMLGLRVRRQSGGDGTLRWSRDGVTPAEPPGVLTRRSIFAWAGQLTSHVPVAGWLRPAAAWLKRAANKVTKDWDSPITDDDLRKQVSDLARRLAECDPARGQWCVSGDSVTVWTDASSIARGVVLSDPTTGEVIEDAAWLRSDSDSDMHINLSELDAALNGMNMAVAWGFKRVILRTDSVTVQRWLTDALTGRARLRTKAQSEMLVRRRVAVFKQLSSEYDLVVTVDNGDDAMAASTDDEQEEEIACPVPTAHVPGQLAIEAPAAVEPSELTPAVAPTEQTEPCTGG